MRREASSFGFGFSGRPRGPPPPPPAGAAGEGKAGRRGTARLDCVWIRWTGPMGLIWKQRQLAVGQPILITPDIRSVSDKSVLLMNQETMHGVKAQLQIGEGAEFEALADYRQG